MTGKNDTRQSRITIPEALRQVVFLLQNGKSQDAAGICRAILDAAPQNFDALHFMGIASAQGGDLEDAIDYFRRALAIQGDSPALLNNLGNALRETKRHEEAVASLEKALALNARFPDALNNLGAALTGLRRHEEAIASFHKALELQPDLADAHCNLGTVLFDIERYEEAGASFRKALELRPDFFEAHLSLANALGRLKHPEKAVATYRKALDLRPDSVEAFTGIADQKRKICDWRGFAETKKQLAVLAASASDPVAPFVFLGFSDDPGEQFACARRYAESNVACPEPLPPVDAHETSGLIRVAYLSADFREHPVAHLTAELFEIHNRSRFELHAIYFGPDTNDPMHRRLLRAFDQFHVVRGKSDRGVAELIRELGIDIAVDLMGYTQHCRPRILGFRPAPVQASYLGYPGTMGVEFIDYILVDHFIVTDDQQRFFSEQLVRLPNCYMVNDTTLHITDKTPTRSDCGLPESGFVFCCFNNSNKLAPDVFDVWMRLLHQIPGSVLWLFGNTDVAQRNLRLEAQARGIDAARLVFARRADLPEHFARHRHADLFLDTLPYNAHTTASDALWAGLPVLTCAGRSFPARVAGSLLHAVGLPELVTHSLEEYEALALRLARNPQLLESYRQRLAENRQTSPLFDCPRFTRNLETAYQTMVDRWKEGREPAPFAVADTSKRV